MSPHYKMTAPDGPPTPLGDRTFEFVVSTGDLDRENDRIRADGWDTREYLTNPVVQFAHDYKSLPIARTTKLFTRGNALIAHAQFPPKTVYPFADTCHDMVVADYLIGASPGFTPGKYEPNAWGGRDYITGHKLLEWSIVPIPANPAAGRMPTTRAARYEATVKSFLGITDSRALRLQPHQVGLDAIRLKSFLEGKADQHPSQFCPEGRACPSRAGQLSICPSTSCPLGRNTPKETRVEDKLFDIDRHDLPALKTAVLAELRGPMRAVGRDVVRELMADVVRPALARHLTATTGRLD